MRVSTLAATAAALLTFSTAGFAQQTAPAKMIVGQWTGTVTPPDAETAQLTYDVAYAGDTLNITINAGAHGTFKTTEAKYEPNKISFKFRPGPEIVCVLNLQGSDYVGVCTEDDGTAAPITMTAPKQDAVKK